MVPFSVIVLILIVVALKKRRKRILNGRNLDLTSYTVKPASRKDNHECVFPNPTYQDVQSSVRPKAVDISPNPSYLPRCARKEVFSTIKEVNISYV